MTQADPQDSSLRSSVSNQIKCRGLFQPQTLDSSRTTRPPLDWIRIIARRLRKARRPAAPTANNPSEPGSGTTVWPVAI